MLARVISGLTYALSSTQDAAFTHIQNRFHLTTSGLETTALSIAQGFCDINEGAMSEMQTDPTNTRTECMMECEVVCTKTKDMARISAYITGGFDPATFFDKFKSMNIDLAKEFSACDFQNLLMVLDQSLSKI